jgi:Rps23 Pro-64 3,4-dihydroxylase Tpa1-like proline 4-hydroxylase
MSDIKIIKSVLEQYEKEDVLNYFGKWTEDIEKLNQKFNSADPFDHIVINNFLNEEYAEEIYKNFPEDYENWHRYMNPLEVKFTNDKINDLPESIKKLFYLLSTDKITELFRDITGITNLEYDEYLHGAGLHAHPRYGRLAMHLDYEKHPITGKQRRTNIILYLSKDWKSEWNGQTELWDKEMKECVKKSSVIFNTAIIFKTNEISWHGVPEKMMCPEDTYRKSFAYYYVSSLEAKASENKFGGVYDGYRHKASFIHRPFEKVDERYKKLCNIRPYRRIEKNDMDEIWQDWSCEKY